MWRICIRINIQKVSEYGQGYATGISYSGNLPIYYNTLYSGMPKAMRRFYPDCEDGTMSRTLFVTLPDQFGKPMPVWGEMNEPAATLMEKHIQRLYEVSIKGSEVQDEHEMDMGFLNEGLTEWMEAQRRGGVPRRDAGLLSVGGEEQPQGAAADLPVRHLGGREDAAAVHAAGGA